MNMNRLVCIIDDSLTIRKIFEISLRRTGYETKTFSNALEVFRWLLRPEASIPAMVFVDACLPNMDGYSLIQRLRTKPAFAHTVFVMISSHGGMLDRLKGRLAGASVYLTKPIRTQEIVRVVQEQLGSALSEDRDTRPKQEAERLAMYGGYR